MVDFGRLRQLIRLEERLSWAIEREEAKATKRTSTIGGIGGGGGRGNKSRVEEGAIELAILRDEHHQIETELEEQRRELKPQLRALSEVGKTFMTMRYIKGLDCKKIAIAMNYSETHVFHVVKESEQKINSRQAQKEGRKRQ